MFQASVSGLYIDQQTGEPVVLLQEVGGDRILPIWIGTNEMLALAVELSSDLNRPPRPLSHDLVETVVSCLNARVVQTVISDLKDHIYRAKLSLKSGSGTLKLDARSSDAIILALKFDAPIFVAEEVVEKRMQLSGASGQKPADLWNRLQQIHPEDFNTLSI